MRRSFLAAALANGFGGNTPRRIDQLVAPAAARGLLPAPTGFLFVPGLVVRGNNGGVFVYNGAGQLIDSMAFAANVDPLTRSNKIDIVTYSPGATFTQLSNGSLFVGSLNPASQIAGAASVSLFDTTVPANQPFLQVTSPFMGLAHTMFAMLFGGSSDNSKPPQLVINPGGGLQFTGGLVEIQGGGANNGSGLVALLELVPSPGTIRTMVLGTRTPAGDTNNRMQMDNNGQMEWGSGLAVSDIFLGRSVSGELLIATVSGFALPAISAPLLELVPSASPNLILGTLISGDTANRYQVSGEGRTYWGPGNAAQDLFLFRSNPQQLTLNNNNAGPQTGALLELQQSGAVPALSVVNVGAGLDDINIQKSGDAHSRLKLQGSSGNGGAIRFGDGTNVVDSAILHQAANLLQVSTADWDIATVGRGLRVAEGANAKQGTATLAAGTVTVANTSVTAVSRIFLTAQDNNSTGALRISARTAGTSFTITSSNAADSGVVAWFMTEPG